MPDARTLDWLASVSETIHDRIARAGLCEPRTPQDAAPTLGGFVAKYLSHRAAELKPASLKRLEGVAERLLGSFGASVRLDD